MSEQVTTISETRRQFRDGSRSVRDVVDEHLRAIDERNDSINAYLGLYDTIDDQVAHAQQRIDDGTATPLTGIPISVKDSILVKGETSSAASRMLEEYTATYDATVIERLREHTPVFIGRTNMDEFSMGSSTENSAFGPTRNPHNHDYVPGGTSGGAAASVAMGGALAALGADTGGSVRQPASFCGRVGLRPTYGAVSRSGLMAMTSSLDQIAPITGNVADTELIFNEIRGVDPHDSTTLPDDQYHQPADDVRTIGVPYHLIEQEGVSEEVKENLSQAVATLETAGYTVRDIELPHFQYALAAYYILMPAEVSSNMARYDGVRYGLREEGEDVNDTYKKTRRHFGDEVQRRIMLGTYVLSSGYYDAYYRKAALVRAKVRQELEKVYEDVEAILLPVSPVPPFQIGEKMQDPLSMYLTDIFTVPASIAGMPALAVPFGEVEKEGGNLPLGVQIMAPMTREDRTFAVGKQLTGEQSL